MGPAEQKKGYCENENTQAWVVDDVVGKVFAAERDTEQGSNQDTSKKQRGQRG